MGAIPKARTCWGHGGHAEGNFFFKGVLESWSFPSCSLVPFSFLCFHHFQFQIKWTHSHYHTQLSFSFMNFLLKSLGRKVRRLVSAPNNSSYNFLLCKSADLKKIFMTFFGSKRYFFLSLALSSLFKSRAEFVSKSARIQARQLVVFPFTNARKRRLSCVWVWSHVKLLPSPTGSSLPWMIN